MGISVQALARGLDEDYESPRGKSSPRGKGGSSNVAASQLDRRVSIVDSQQQQQTDEPRRGSGGDGVNTTGEASDGEGGGQGLPTVRAAEMYGMMFRKMGETTELVGISTEKLIEECLRHDTAYESLPEVAVYTNPYYFDVSSINFLLSVQLLI